MKRTLTILIFTLVFVYLQSLIFSRSVTAITVQKAPETVEEWIEYYANRYGANYDELLAVAKCESNLKVNVLGDNGKAYSVFQFHKPTFDRWEKELGEDLDYNNFQHHIKLASWAFSQGESYKDDWTCWTRYHR